MSDQPEKPNTAKAAFQEENKNISENNVCLVETLGQLFCLSLPNLYNYNGLSVWYILYAVLFLIFLLVLLVYTLFYKLQNCYGSIDKTAIIDIIVMCFVTITNMVSVLCVIFCKRKKLVNAVKQTEEVNILLKISAKKENKVNRTSVLTAFLHILLLTSLSVTLIVYFLKLEDIFIMNYIIALVNLYMVIINSLHILNYSIKLGRIIENLNKKLLDVPSYMKKFKNSKKKPASSSAFLKTQDQLCDITEMYNDVFEFPVLLTSCLCVLQTLQTLNLLLEVVLRNSISINITITDVVLSVLWSVVLCVSIK